jgi:hypothetical protein
MKFQHSRPKEIPLESAEMAYALNEVYGFDAHRLHIVRRSSSRSVMMTVKHSPDEPWCILVVMVFLESDE